MGDNGASQFEVYLLMRQGLEELCERVEIIGKISDRLPVRLVVVDTQSPSEIDVRQLYVAFL